MPDESLRPHAPGAPAAPAVAEPPEHPADAPTAATAPAPRPPSGTGLCLSGGGYRAMLFHLGTLWRLNELGFLPRLTRISSVSGGSITAAFLALRWDALRWTGDTAADFPETVAEPICRLADHTIDVGSGITGILLPGQTVGDRIAKAYRKHLFGDATLQDLPDDTAGRPVFVINATNVQTGALFRFMRRYMADYRIGRADHPTVSLHPVPRLHQRRPLPPSPPCRHRPRHPRRHAGEGADLQLGVRGDLGTTPI